MGLPGKPMVWSPKSVSDTLDASTAFSGAMASLADLIPDPTTTDLWQCRPAALPFVDFVAGGFNTPGLVSCSMTIGTRIFGMIGTQLVPGRDMPFAYETTTGAFVIISNIIAANMPVTQPTVGDWNPPTMALVGSKIIVSHPGFAAISHFFGVLDISNPASYAWSAGNTSGNLLAAPPQWVAAFNGRCFFLVNPPGSQPGAYMSDSLAPTVITNANQVLTFGDNTPLTCAAGLPLSNQLGGVIQSLMIFKGISNIYQVTGDYALMDLAINTLNVATGTLAPNTLCSTSKGLSFIAPDGLRQIDFAAHVGDPIGNAGTGISLAFIQALTPSRMNAAYNSGIYRVQVQNGAASGSPQQQYWFDFVRGVWSGPHSIATNIMVPFGATFVVSLQGVNGEMYRSDPVQSSTATYVENGRQLTYTFSTAMLPDTDQMSEIAMVETTVAMALPAQGAPATAAFINQDVTVLDTVLIPSPASSTIWGAFIWGQAPWQGSVSNLYPRRLAWHYPLVFRRGQLQVTGASSSGVKIGRTHFKYQVLGYLQMETATADN